MSDPIPHLTSPLKGEESFPLLPSFPHSLLSPFLPSLIFMVGIAGTIA